MRLIPSTASRITMAMIAMIAAIFASAMARAEPLSPADVFGFQPGDDFKLASYEQMGSFYRQLAAESDRVDLREIGQSVLGRPLYLLTITSARNHASLVRYRSISEQLARARVDDATATALVDEGRAVVWIDGGLHATELAHGQMTTELAWRVATDESAEMRAIRDNVIFLLMPVMNPDGLEIVRKWYESQLGTPFEQTSPPELYHHYVGHDNNRDFFMNNMPESKAVSMILYNEWYPQIVYNQHQSSPGFARIVIPPYSDPVNPIIHPGVTTGVTEIGSAMGNRFALERMPGAISDVGYSMWWNGGMRTVPYFHNMIGILTETGHDSPSPRFYDPKLFPRMLAVRANASAVDLVLDEDASGVPDARVLYPLPWPGGESRFREPVEFMLTGSIAVLRAAADSRTKWLTNIYRMGRDAISSGMSGTRYYIIPAGQRHADEAVNLVNVLYEGGIEIARADESFRVGDIHYAEGSFIIDAAQAFRPYIVDLLEKQTYPDTRLDPSGQSSPPYDIAGWTLPMQMSVTVDQVADEIDVDATPLNATVDVEPGAVSGNAGFGYALSHARNASIKAVNALLRDGESVFWSNESFRAGRTEFDAGTFVIDLAGDLTVERVDNLAHELGLDFTGLGSRRPDELSVLSMPRVGLYKSWAAFMDEGWTRWLLEDYGFDPVSLNDEDMRSGNLSAFDAIVIPHPDAGVYFKDNVEKILTGHAPGTMPEEYTGGMGLKGAFALQEFVRNGGTVVTLGDASSFAMRQFGLPVRNVVAGAAPQEFSIPGSLLRATVDTADPLGYGMPQEVAVNFVNGAAFAVLGQAGCADDLLNQRDCREIARGGRPLEPLPSEPRFDSIVHYAAEDMLMSGWETGAMHIANKPAMVRVPHGDGEVIMFGFRPQFRGQPRGTYKLLFNALYAASIDE